MAVLREVLTEALERHRDRTAVGGSRGALTYGELDEASTRFAERFPGGERVAIYAGNSPTYLIVYIGLIKAGAVPFLMDPALGATEIAKLIGACGIDVFAHDRELPGAPPIEARDEFDGLLLSRVTSTGNRPELLAATEVCRFSSGSTGTPNCIEFSGTAVHNAALAWRSASGMEADERLLCFAGLFNGLAFNTSLLPAFLAGASLWLPSGLPTSGHVMRFLHEVRPTWLTGFPALYESLVRRDVRVPELGELRVALSSAAPLKAETAAALREKQDLAVCDYYGIAETGPLTFNPAPEPGQGKGFPLPGVEFVVHDGVIRVRSTSMGSRYLNTPGGFEQRLDEAGFYVTGDEGHLDDGRLFLRGRTAKVANIGGRKIDTEEVRAALLASGVSEAAVFAAEKHNGDPMLVAVVSGNATEHELRTSCLERLAVYKVPERIMIVDRVPVTSLGKPRIDAVRELFARATTT